MEIPEGNEIENDVCVEIMNDSLVPDFRSFKRNRRMFRLDKRMLIICRHFYLIFNLEEIILVD